MSTATKNSYQWANKVDIERIFSVIWMFSVQPFVEVYNGWKLKVIPMTNCLMVGAFAQIIVIFGWDFLLFKKLGLTFIYPVNLFFRLPYLFAVALFGVWAWGFLQVILQKRLIKKLTTVFIDAGLKSASGRLPSFISDVPIDAETRHLCLKKNGASMDQWSQASDKLAEDLQIYIDNFKDNRPEGTVDVFYAHNPMSEKYEYESHNILARDEFFIGKARTKLHKIDFNKCPHYLVGGQTDFGKSHFLNQAITSLYLNNKDYTFELVDLKFGAEFGLNFSDLPRVNVHDSAASATMSLKRIADKTIKERAQFLSHNKCQNILDLRELPNDDLKIPEGSSIKKKFGRMVIVIDEAFELFMKNPEADAQNASTARQKVIKIAAQGRSVGIHILLGTQRPDSKAIDSMIKANLPGKICFPVPNNATSMTILDCGRGAQLPRVKGRCIWKIGGEMVEVQAPYLPKERIAELLKDFKKVLEPEEPVKQEVKEIESEEDPGDQLMPGHQLNQEVVDHENK